MVSSEKAPELRKEETESRENPEIIRYREFPHRNRSRNETFACVFPQNLVLDFLGETFHSLFNLYSVPVVRPILAVNSELSAFPP
jgi:hypothetical protein